MLSNPQGKEVGAFRHCPFTARNFVNESLLENKFTEISNCKDCLLCPRHPCFQTDKSTLSGGPLRDPSFYSSRKKKKKGIFAARCSLALKSPGNESGTGRTIHLLLIILCFLDWCWCQEKKPVSFPQLDYKLLKDSSQVLHPFL